MPVSKKKRNKKTNSFGTRKKERRDLKMEALRLERMRNRRSSGSIEDYLSSSLITQSLSNMRARRKSNKEDL